MAHSLSVLAKRMCLFIGKKVLKVKEILLEKEWKMLYNNQVKDENIKLRHEKG